MVDVMASLPYEERLEVLGLSSLHTRGRKNDLIQAYRSLHGIDQVDCALFNKVSDYHNRDTRSSSKSNFVVHKSRLGLRKYFFSNRVIADWNILPQQVQEAKSLTSFKSHLKLVQLQ